MIFGIALSSDGRRPGGANLLAARYDRTTRQPGSRRMAAGASNSTESAASPATSLVTRARPRWLQTGLAAAADLLFPPRCGCCGDDCVALPGAPLLCVRCVAELAGAN